MGRIFAKKYPSQTWFSCICIKFSFSRKRHLANARWQSNFTYDRLSNIIKVRLQERNKISDIYVRDDNSITTADQKDTITRFKIKIILLSIYTSSICQRTSILRFPTQYSANCVAFGWRFKLLKKEILAYAESMRIFG